MTGRHAIAPTTHTLELTQLHDLNRSLALPHDVAAVSAQALGIAGQSISPDRRRTSRVAMPEISLPESLPAGAFLAQVIAEGPPACPYLFGMFNLTTVPGGPVVFAALHTDALRRLSRALGLRHRWGVEASVHAVH